MGAPLGRRQPRAAGDLNVRFWNLVSTRLQSLMFRHRREVDLRDELQFHLEREAEQLQADGMPPDAARRAALRTFGGVEPTKEACRDARGTALLDTVVRDARYTWRSFRRAPLAAATIVTTVGLGLGLVAVVFTILNAVMFRVDAVRNPYELFSVQRQGPAEEESGAFTRPQFEALLRETSVFSDAFATTSDVEGWIDGIRMEGRLVTGNFFGVLGVNAARGRTFTPADDQPGGAAIIVLSHRTWTQHFASDPGVLNRTIRLNGTPFQIVGVMPEGFRGLEVIAAPAFWAPLSLLGRFRPGLLGTEDTFLLQAVGRLTPELSREQALARLLVWDSNRGVERNGERPVASLVLQPRTGTAPQPAESLVVFMPLLFAFGLILMIGCANVANLLLARGVARQREIGIRLAIGASRRRIVWQLLTESLLLASVAAGLAFLISRFVLTAVVYVMTSTFPPEIGNLRVEAPPADWRVAVFLVAGAIMSTVFFALGPALQATRVDVVRAMRGELVRDARPGRARDVLVALQVTGSVLLLICAAIFLRSSWAAASVDPGIRTAGIVNVRVLNEQRRGAIVDAMRNEPYVAAMATSWPSFIGGLGSLPAFANGASGRSPVTYQFVSPEYFGVFGIDVVRGRSFTDSERTPNAAVAVVNETVARELWPGADPVGQVLRVEPNPPRAMHKPDDPLQLARTVDIVGVVRDVPGFRLGGTRFGGAGVYLPVGAEVATTSLTLQVRVDSERARQLLVDRLAAIDADLGEVSTLQTIARTETYLFSLSFWLTVVLGTLALILTVSGLFSLLSYIVEQRTREIGVRMALGATRRSVASHVLAQSATPVGIGVVLGGSLTAALGALLLATPAAEMIGSSVRLFDPVAYAASLLFVLTACTCAALVPALRATRIDPIGALRQE
jgi:predicted permease